MIPFQNIPADTRVPLAYFELDPSKANTAQQVQRTLIIGQKLGGGTGAANVPVRSQGVADARVVGGAGSMLAAATAAYRLNDPLGEVWYLPIADDGAAVAATGAITFTGPTTASGTVALYVGGQLLQLSLASGATAAQAATAFIALVTGTPDLLVAAVIDGVNNAKVNLTAKNAGLASGDVDVRLNYLGAPGGQALPAGLGVAITAMSGGAGNPALTAGLSALQDMPFDFIVCPYTDAASLAAMRGLLDFTAGRWAPTSQVFGHAFAAYRGTSGQLTTFGLTQNDAHMTIVGVYDSPSPAWLWAAAVAGAAALSARNDPALPLQTVAVQGVSAPPASSRFSRAMRDTLLHSGISTFTANSAGEIAIENLITTYQQTAAGQSDTSYLEVETLFTLVAVIRRIRLVVTTKFARVKLAADGVRLVPGSNVVTPSIIRAEIIAAYRQMEQEDGWVQQSQVFAANLVVQKSAATPGRVEALIPAVLIEQLRVFAALVQFRPF